MGNEVVEPFVSKYDHRLNSKIIPFHKPPAISFSQRYINRRPLSISIICYVKYDGDAQVVLEYQIDVTEGESYVFSPTVYDARVQSPN
jgi:hypothetical protein